MLSPFRYRRPWVEVAVCAPLSSRIFGPEQPSGCPRSTPRAKIARWGWRLFLFYRRNIMRFYPRANRNGSRANTYVYRHIGICPYRSRRRNFCALFLPRLLVAYFSIACVTREIKRNLKENDDGDIAARWKCQRRLHCDLLTCLIFQPVLFP